MAGHLRPMKTAPPPDEDPDATRLRPSSPGARSVSDAEATIVRAPAVDDPDATVVRSRPPPAMPAGTPRPLAPAAPAPLPAGTRLHEYRIDGVLGQGGFGITYLATDVHLNARVAIKEYLPAQIAFRAGDRSVSPNASRHRESYRQGLESFLVEARTLAAFRHPAIVRVARFFEAHRTAYMVLEYERGEPLKAWWPRQRGIGEAALVELLLPLLDGLAVVHAAGFLHRDIKPDNIQVRQGDGSLVLLDFGSAGLATVAAAQVVLTPGYAPIEQYGLGEQGPWTDLYALGATLYWVVSGRKPPDAETRSADPQALVPAVVVGQGRWGAAFLKAIDWALETDPRRRPQDLASFRRALAADHFASLGLQEALLRGDSRLDGGDDGLPSRRRWRGRLHAGWRALGAPRDWPLALKMTLAMLATALLPMVVTAAYNLRGSLLALADSELQYVQQMAHGSAARLAQLLDDGRQLGRVLASDAALLEALAQPADAAVRETLAARLARVDEADPDVGLIVLFDAGGRRVAASRHDGPRVGDAGLRELAQALAGRPAGIALEPELAGGSAGLVHAVPVHDDDGKVVGALLLHRPGASLAAILDAVRHDSALTPALVDGDGVLVHHPQAEMRWRSLAPLPAATQAALRAEGRYGGAEIRSLGEPALAQALRGARAPGTLSYASTLSGRDETAGYAPVPGSDWVVLVTQSRDDFEAPLTRLRNHLLWSLGLVGMLFAGLALRFARSIVRPLRALNDAAEALKAGRFDGAGVVVGSRDEIGRLGRTFNVMVDVLRQRERERGRDTRRDGAGPAA